MKKLSIILALIIASMSAYSQAQSFGYKDYSFQNQVNIGGGFKNTTSSAWLQIGPAAGASTKGLLLPRGDRNQVVSPVMGLIYYDTVVKKVYQFNGSIWVVVGSSGSGALPPLAENHFYVGDTSASPVDAGNKMRYIGQTLYLTPDANTHGIVVYASGSGAGIDVASSGYPAANAHLGISNVGYPELVGQNAPFNIGAQSGSLNLYTDGVNDVNIIPGGQLNIGTKATAPTGTNGGIYYNTTSNKFQGYVNGAWKDFSNGGNVSLSDKYIAYGDASGNVTGSNKFTWDASNDEMNFAGTLFKAGLVFGNYSSIGSLWNGAGFVFGTGVKPTTADNSLIKLNASGSHAQWITMRYDRGISFITGNDGAAGTVFNDVDNERMRIADNGRVLIGSPISDYGDYKLQVTGEALISDKLTLNGAGTRALEIPGGSGYEIYFAGESGANIYSNSTTGAMWFNTAGAPIRFGNSDGSNVLEISGDNSVTVANRFRVGNIATAPTGTNGAVYYNTTSNKFQGYVNGAWTDFATTGDVTGVMHLAGSETATGAKTFSAGLTASGGPVVINQASNYTTVIGGMTSYFPTQTETSPFLGTTQTIRMFREFNENGSVGIPANQSMVYNQFVQQSYAISAASSGTHDLVAMVAIDPPRLSGNALTATNFTNGATLYIDGPPTMSGGAGGTIVNPYSLWIYSGATKLGGSLYLPGLSSATTSSMLYINPSTGQVTTGAVPTGGTTIGDLQATTDAGHYATNDIGLKNTTAATSSVQQPSPVIIQAANYWNTTTTASDSVRFRTWVNPVASTSSSNSSSWKLQSSVGTAGWNEIINVPVSGNITISRSTDVIGYFSANNGTFKIGDVIYLNGWIGGTNTNHTLIKNYAQPSGGTMTAGDNWANFYWYGVNVTEAATGTHHLLANQMFNRNTLNNGAGTTDYGATVYIDGSMMGQAPTLGNYAFWVDSGEVRIDGPLNIDGSVGTAGQVLTSAGPGLAPTWTTPSGGSGGSGTVTDFSAGDASGLFTTSEATTTTTPALTFNLNTQASNTVFAGPTTGTAAAPTFRTLVPADMGSGTATSGSFLRGDQAWATLTNSDIPATLTGKTLAAASNSVEGILYTIRYLTTGTTYTPSTGVKKIEMILVGAGGGGGGVTGAASSVGVGAGGGAGAILRKYVTVSDATTYTYAIGTAGTAGANTGGAGGTGGATSITIAGTTYTANGGGGGLGQTAGTALALTVGGTAGTGSNGDLNGGGQNGDNGVRLSSSVGISGGGGTSYYGTGGAPITSAGNGNAATGYGAGGGGAISTANASRTGGAGSQGIIIIYEYK